MAIWWGPIAAQLAKLGYSTASRELLKRRLVKDASGKPRPFYHGTRAKFEGDITPTADSSWARLGPDKKLYMSTNPKTADYYSMYPRPWENTAGLRTEGARTYKKYLAPMRGKDRGVRFETARRWSDSRPDELHGVISDPRVLVPPYAIAPPPLPNFLPRLAPPAIGTQR